MAILLNIDSFAGYMRKDIHVWPDNMMYVYWKNIRIFVIWMILNMRGYE